ncbi:MAG: insulinase family protein [Fibrobacterota bacterium]|nr:insulinase family protein [Fibrobacterota bacterium]
MKHKIRVLTIVAAACMAASPARADIKAQYAVLDNGLKVILFPDRQSPTVACRLFYVTGSVHERPGNTGIAHLLEHMLFKGTKKVGIRDAGKDAVFVKQIDEVMARYRGLTPGDSAIAKTLKAKYDSLIAEERKLFIKYELWEAYEKAGGTGLNAFTSDLMTAYIVTLPKNKVDLFLWLESDRMQNAVLREFYSERDVVMEERRMRVEDSPTGRYWESLMGVFYEAHPFRFPTIGYPSDIRNLTREQADHHYREYYKPNNAILVLAGDIEAPQAMAGIKKYFGGMRRGSEFPPIVTEEPEQPGEKRLIIRKNNAKPRFDLLFHTPGFDHHDLYALDIVEGVLSGKSGRLYRKLVKELKIALGASGGNGLDKYTSNFSVSVDLDGNPQLDKVEKAVWEVLYDLGQKPITERELTRAKNQVAARSTRQLLDKEELATELAFWEMRGGWDHINTFPERVQQVTAQQVQDVCKKYFHRKNSTAGVILPEEAAPPAKASAGKSGKAGKGGNESAVKPVQAPAEGGAE